MTGLQTKAVGHVADLHEVLLPVEWVRAALVLAFCCTWVVIGLFAYLNRHTRKSHFSMWTVAWMFYAMFLAAAIGLEEWPSLAWLMLARRACIGISALFMAWGSFELTGHPRKTRELAAGCVMIVLWSCAGVYLAADFLVVNIALFALLALASAYTGSLYFRYRRRYRGANILATGFILWSVYLLGFPFMVEAPHIMAIGYYASASLSLFIAMGMMMQTLEQTRERNETLIGEFKKGAAQRRLLRQEVVVNEQKYRALFDTASDAILLVDVATQQIIEANEAALHLSGRTGAELVARSFFDLCPHLQQTRDEWNDPARVWDWLLRNSREYAIVRADGTHCSCEGNANLVQVNQRPVFQINLREITERKRLEQQMRQVEKLSALGKLVAGVAHELNNPLAVVVGYAQILARQDHPDERTRTSLQKMLHECERASKIVRNLLTFARPREPLMEAVDINRLVTSTLETREAELRGLGIRLTKRLTPAALRTMADPHLLEQVLANLITNAVHALSGRDGRRLLEVTTRQDDQLIRISVADSGPGVPAELLGKVFDPFFTTKAAGQGTGLGLSICYSIMEEHGGRIWVESEPGNGAAFIIELPIVACPDHTDDPPRELSLRPTDPQAPTRRLLVVDDEPGIIEVLQQALGERGWHVETAHNGAAALEALDESEYDLIITDLCMPEMDGKQFYRTIEQTKPALAERFMFVTGDTMNTESREFLESTRRVWLSKPFQIGELVELVTSALRNGVPTPGAA